MKTAGEFVSELRRSVINQDSLVEARDADWQALVEAARREGEIAGLRKAMNKINMRSKCDCEGRIGEEIEALIAKAEA